MPQFGLAVVNIANARISLYQFRQVSNVTYEPERQLFCGPSAAIEFDLQLFVKLIEPKGGFFQISVIQRLRV